MVTTPDIKSRVYGTNMGPTWYSTQVGPMLAIWTLLYGTIVILSIVLVINKCFVYCQTFDK